MTTYVDTSVLAAYYCPESISALAERTLRSLIAPMISDPTMVELTSAVSRKIREKTFSREEGAHILTQFETRLDEGYYSHDTRTDTRLPGGQILAGPIAGRPPFESGRIRRSIYPHR